MCQNLEKVKKTEVTVYKVVAVKKNRRKDNMYSPFNGMEYKEGKVPVIKKKRKCARAGFGGNYHNPRNINFTVLMVGKTSGFSRRCDAKEFLDDQKTRMYNYDFELRLAKLVLSGDIAKGYFCTRNVYAGSFIKSVKLI